MASLFRVGPGQRQWTRVINMDRRWLNIWTIIHCSFHTISWMGSRAARNKGGPYVGYCQTTVSQGNTTTLVSALTYMNLSVFLCLDYVSIEITAKEKIARWHRVEKGTSSSSSCCLPIIVPRLYREPIPGLLSCISKDTFNSYQPCCPPCPLRSFPTT